VTNHDCVHAQDPTYLLATCYRHCDPGVPGRPAAERYVAALNGSCTSVSSALLAGWGGCSHVGQPSTLNVWRCAHVCVLPVCRQHQPQQQVPSRPLLPGPEAVAQGGGVPPACLWRSAGMQRLSTGPQLPLPQLLRSQHPHSVPHPALPRCPLPGLPSPADHRGVTTTASTGGDLLLGAGAWRCSRLVPAGQGQQADWQEQQSSRLLCPGAAQGPHVVGGVLGSSCTLGIMPLQRLAVSGAAWQLLPGAQVALCH